MDDHHFSDIETKLWKAVWLSIVTGAVAGPVIFATQLIVGKSLLVALSAWGVFALLPSVVLGFVLLIVTFSRTCPKYPSCLSGHDLPYGLPHKAYSIGIRS